MLYILSLAVLFVLLSTKQVNGQGKCSSGQETVLLHFDDITLTPASFAHLPLPYKGFILRTSAFGNPPVFLKNTTTDSTANVYYIRAASTPPNLVFTDGKSLTITSADLSVQGKKFGVLNFTVASIFFQDMAFLVQALRSGKVVRQIPLNLTQTLPTTVEVNEQNIDTLLLSCGIDDINLCAHMAFDSFTLCHWKKGKNKGNFNF